MTGATDSISDGRRRAMLRTAMGPTIAAALADPLVVEVMVNPDGVLRLDRLGEGRTDTQVRYDPAQVERIIRLVASHGRTEVHAASPIVSAELPPHGEGAGERFEGVLPPVSLAPCFSIRKPATRIYTLLDYVTDGIMSADIARLLSLAVVDRRNILVAGGTSSGKTTLANALLAEMAHLDERVILIEDTRELQSPASRHRRALRTRAGAVTMADLVRSTLRLRPDRIIVGEVRGGEALDMLKAWNTGHPGGIATVHANSAAVSALPDRTARPGSSRHHSAAPGRRGDRHDRLHFRARHGAPDRFARARRRPRSRRRLRAHRSFNRPTLTPRRRLTMHAIHSRFRTAPMIAATAIAMTAMMSAQAWAAGSGMPWEEPLQKVLESVQGPVAKIVAVMIIIVTGLTLAFGETAGGFRKLIQIVFGLSIAFAASSFFLSFFSFGGGALIG